MNMSGVFTCTQCGKETPWPFECDDHKAAPRESKGVSRWISVDAELPPLDVPVLVWKDGEALIDRRLSDPDPKYSHWANSRTDEVSHWMPRPKGPQ